MPTPPPFSRPPTRFRPFLHLLSLLSLLLLTACASAGNPTPANPEPTPPPTATAAPAIPDAAKTLTLRYWQAPSLPFPYLSGGHKDWDAAAVTLQPLANYAPDGSLRPTLAAVIPTLANGGISPDQRAITWTLKPDVRWSDGRPLTAADVVFTWQYCIAPQSGCASRDFFDGIAAVTAVDDLTVKITFTDPTPWPYTPFVGYRTPIISRSQFAQCLGPAAAGCAAQNAAPLGTGPYHITHFTPNSAANYAPNPYYHGPKPYFDRVELHGGGSALSAAQAVLQTATADYAWNLQIDPDTLQQLESLGHGQLVVAFASLVERIAVNQANPDPALGDNRSEYLDGQNPHPFLTYTPIPQAMSMALDRPLIARQLYGFAAAPTCNIIAGPPPYVSTANDSCLAQDIAAANQLLDDHGVRDTDNDGIREYNGVPLRVTYQTSVNPLRQDTQTLIQDWWRQIGIDAALLQHDAALFFGADPESDPAASYRRFFADVQMYADSSGIDPQRYFADQLCANIPNRANHWAGGNVPRACNPDYDRLFAQLPQTPAGPQRAALIKQLNDRHIQNYYQIPIVNRGLVSAHANNLQSVQPNGWDSSLWNIAQWHR